MATANVFVPQAASATQYTPPAQAEASDVRQWLLSPSFLLAVAQGSTTYARLLDRGAATSTSAVSDLNKNLSVSAAGSTLMRVTYSSSSAELAFEVTNSLVTEIPKNGQRLQQIAQQSSQNTVNYYQSRFNAAIAQQAKSSAALSQYLQKHKIDPATLNTQALIDTKLASLSAQTQVDAAAVAVARQNLLSAQNQVSRQTIQPSVTMYLLDAPSVTTSSHRTRDILSVLIALLLGALLGAAFIVGSTAVDQSIRYPEEVEGLLGMPCISAVPRERDLAKTRLNAAHRTIQASPIATPLAAGASTSVPTTGN